MTQPIWENDSSQTRLCSSWIHVVPVFFSNLFSNERLSEKFIAIPHAWAVIYADLTMEGWSGLIMVEISPSALISLTLQFEAEIATR